ncbi:hypothetical protein GPECTOR_50g572 [Gonium pectorale]|uniref:Protein NO VEIN C-terminal domain-containing protein n=1 Tax=Gonium pectorale TaxID=33097 RepID=A0A150G7D9_GONPE|nr:hypothetical protein GPECTOR_50g572 [Gonium pectorale]|eukprot:KXZ45779.1 hypothetical protein GPECTOR_50g572 [Gonium pectorale]
METATATANRPPTLSARVTEQLQALAEALEALWQEERYGQGLALRSPVALLPEHEALEELLAGGGCGGGGGGGGPAGTFQAAGVESMPTSFFLTLLTRSWLPTSGGHAVKPSEALPRLQKLVDMFGDAPLPFLSGSSPAPAGPLAAALGLPRQLTPQLVVSLLHRLASGDALSGAAHGAAATGAAAAAAAVPSFAAMVTGRPQAAPPGAAVALELERMARVYRYLGGAAQHAGEEAFAAVCAAFASEALIWIPDVPVPAAAGRPTGAVRGRFHRVEQVALHDPTGVLEAMREGADEPAGGGVLRILDAHYQAAVLPFFEELCAVRPAAAAPGGWALLGDQPLVGRQPSLDAYVAALKRVAAQDAQAGARSMQQVRAIMQPWADGLASGAMPESGPLAMRLRLLLPHLAVFPTVAGGWASVSSGLLINDDRELARVFGRATGVHILDAAFCEGLAADGGAGAAAGGGRDSLALLLHLLRVPRLSLSVREEVEYEGIRAGWAVERLVRVSLTFAQRFLLHRRPETYAAVRLAAAARLPRLQVFVVNRGSLQVSPKLVHPDGRPPVASPEGPRPRAAVLQLRDGGVVAAAAAAAAAATTGAPAAPAPWLLVDDVRNYNKVCEELSRLFTPSGLPDAGMASFLMCLLLSHEQDPDPQRDLLREAAEIYASDQGCLPLPEGEEAWEVSLGTLQPESTAAAVAASADPQPHELPEYDPDELLAALAPAEPKEPREPRPEGSAAPSQLRLPDILAAGEGGNGEELLASLNAAVAAAGGEVLPDGAAADVAEAGVSRDPAARWAEALVFQLLRRDTSVAEAGWSVEWVSDREDMRFAPYDIIMTRGAPPDSLQRMYVEVKSSTSANKRSFEISTQELCKAQQERESYVIFRVLGVGSLTSLELLVLADPWAMCARKELRLCMLTA